MPILPAEPDLFPSDLLDRASSESGGPEWVVLHTLPRREKDLMRRLRQIDVPYYGPTIARRFRSPNGRKRTSFVPLFPGYVFSKIDAEQKQAVFLTGCICQNLPVADPERLLADLRQIQRLVAADAPLTPEARLEAGSRVRVRSGPMVGIEGVVVRRRGQNRLLVSVDLLRCGASVALDDCELEPL